MSARHLRWAHSMRRALLMAALAAPLLGAGRGAAVTVVLINGGMSPAKNYHSHLLHLEGMHAALQARGIAEPDISVLCSDGEDPAPDMVTRRSVSVADIWLVEGTAASKLLPRVERVDTPWAGPRSPATPAALQAWLATAPVRAGDTLLLYTTDHGFRDGDVSGLSMWGKTRVEPSDLEQWLAPLPDGVRTVMVMSHCYSGAFADIALSDGLPDGSVCGFFSAPRDRPAYGCYPESRSRPIGHGFRFIDALASAETLSEAHQQVLLTDRTPDVPLTTSDLFLRQLVAEDAAAAGVDLAERADALLASHPRRPSRKRSQSRERDDALIDALAGGLGLPRPAGLGELPALEKRALRMARSLKDAAKVWQSRLEREAQSNLAALLVEQPQWQDVLDHPREEDLPALVEALEAQAQARGALPRMQALAERLALTDAAQWQAKVRAAGVQRIEAVMLRQAGEVLLQGRGLAPQREALQALRDCESAAIGAPPEQEQPPLPPAWIQLADAEQEAQSLQPSLLGVQLEALTESERALLALGDQGVRVVEVRPGTPAEQAGLLAGDILIGPPGAHLAGLDAVRSWAALAPRDQAVVIEVIRQGAQVAMAVEFGVRPARY